MPLSRQIITALFVIACSSCGNQPEKIAAPTTQDTQQIASTLPVSQDSFAHSSHDLYSSGTDTARLNAAMDMIFKLPEVQEIDSTIRQATQGKHGASIMLRDEWNQDTTCYNFMVGNNSHEERYENIFNFVMDKKTGEIKVYDPVVDSVLSITDWRKTKP